MQKLAKLSRIPQPKSWLPMALVSLALAALCGLAGMSSTFLTSEFEINKALNANGNRLLTDIAVFASEIYSPKWAIVLTLVIAVAIWLLTKSRIDALGFMAIIAAGWLPAEVFKLSFNEPRPDTSLLLEGSPVPLEIDSAFPSGHLCFALAIGYAVFILAKNTKAQNWALLFWILSSAVMGWARLFAGVHYLNDLAGSLFTSLAGVLLFAYLWNNWLFAAITKTRFFRQP
jgi:membrane-associated phospholipid phosphatase